MTYLYQNFILRIIGQALFIRNLKYVIKFVDICTLQLKFRKKKLRSDYLFNFLIVTWHLIGFVGLYYKITLVSNYFDEVEFECDQDKLMILLEKVLVVNFSIFLHSTLYR